MSTVEGLIEYRPHSAFPLLPSDVLNLVFELLQFSVVLPLRVVCREWSTAITPRLYKDVVVRNERAVRLFIRTLTTTQLGSLVESVCIGGTLRGSSWFSRLRPFRTRTWGWDIVIDTILAQCPHITAVHLDVMYGKSVTIPIRRITNQHPHVLSLTHLDISEPESRRARTTYPLRRWSHWLSDSLAAGAVVIPNLQFLTLKGFDVPRSHKGRIISWSSLPQLRSFSLFDSHIHGSSLGAIIVPLLSAAPSLKELRLVRVHFSLPCPGTRSALYDEIEWPTVAPIRRLIIDGGYSPADLMQLLEPAAASLEEFECRIHRWTSKPSWPRFSRLQKLKWHAYDLLGVGSAPELFAAAIPTLTHLELHSPSSSTMELLQSSSVLESLTLSAYDFHLAPSTGSQAILATLRTISTLKLWLNKHMEPDFYRCLPLNIQSLHILPLLEKEYFEEIIRILEEQQNAPRYPLLKAVHIRGDRSLDSVVRHHTLKEACEAVDIQLFVHVDE